jgi:hypothetical protein
MLERTAVIGIAGINLDEPGDGAGRPCWPVSV